MNLLKRNRAGGAGRRAGQGPATTPPPQAVRSEPPPQHPAHQGQGRGRRTTRELRRRTTRSARKWMALRRTATARGCCPYPCPSSWLLLSLLRVQLGNRRCERDHQWHGTLSGACKEAVPSQLDQYNRLLKLQAWATEPCDAWGTPQRSAPLGDEHFQFHCKFTGRLLVVPFPKKPQKFQTPLESSLRFSICRRRRLRRLGLHPRQQRLQLPVGRMLLQAALLLGGLLQQAAQVQAR